MAPRAPWPPAALASAALAVACGAVLFLIPGPVVHHHLHVVSPTAAAAIGRPVTLRPRPADLHAGGPRATAEGRPSSLSVSTPLTAHPAAAMLPGRMVAAVAALCAFAVAAVSSLPSRLSSSAAVAAFATTGQKKTMADCLQDTYAIACRTVLTAVDLPDDADRSALDSILKRSLNHARLLLFQSHLDDASAAILFPYWPDTLWQEGEAAREWGLTHILPRDETFGLLEQLKVESLEDVTAAIADEALSLEVIRSQPALQYAVLFLAAALAVLLADMKHSGDAEDAHGAASDAVAAVKAAVGFLSSPRITGDGVVALVEESYAQ